ncbi:hypothetical protein GOP47_0025666 [Adiantum capillus-veneris]|uniref:Uncharacterized protein n=1 Tax=Adiantum capillus-veneris TaxID=13818 RepID=A0A9D4Z3R8_ADICA|nr:hypothetical protein GOP47_0025666 [Adiantum capillus-veneris]
MVSRIAEGSSSAHELQGTTHQGLRVIVPPRAAFLERFVKLLATFSKIITEMVMEELIKHHVQEFTT